MLHTAPFGYARLVSPLFRRKPVDLVEDATASVTETAPPDNRRKNYTPSKKELGVVTPKRVPQGRRVETAPADRKEAMKQMRDKQRIERAEASAGMRNGDERYLLARDRGPERSLVRDIVDSRRTIGSFFIAGAVIVMVGSLVKNDLVALASNVLWALLAFAVVVDSIFISRRIKRTVQARFPKTDQRMGSLYLYGIMRGLTFRRMRVPKTKVELGAKI
ncbi:membrane protein [Actinoplanes regularis]|nr:membrane protein [Actinoplanes regularis]